MIRVANPADVSQILDVIKSSILSCELDHQHDEQTIAAWLANKDQQHLEQWLQDHFSLLYQQDQQIVGFILMSKTAEILLNYVKPTQQKLGIGRELLQQMYGIATANGLNKIEPESTLSAKDFYLSQGFSIVNDVYEQDQLVGYRMQLGLG